MSIKHSGLRNFTPDEEEITDSIVAARLAETISKINEIKKPLFGAAAGGGPRKQRQD